MPPIEHPGVYVEERPFGIAPIAGVETSTAAFVGEAAGGPAASAVNVRSFAEFERVFGGLDSGSELGYALWQFFSAGGGDAWVVRVSEGAPPSEVFRCLEAADELGLLCLPGEADPDVLVAGLAYAERRRAFLLVDPPGVEPARATALVRALARGESASGAVFYPPVQVLDPLADWALRTCPPSGAVAGMYARFDRLHGVWKPPAGSDAVLQGVAAAAVDLSDAEVSELTAAGLNCIRRDPAARIVVWSAQTLDAAGEGESEWKYVNVRRMFAFLEASVERGTQWAVFETNDERVWAQVRLQTALFLDRLFHAGAFRGRTPAEAYFVRCGRDTMTQNDLDNGRLKLLVGFAPLKPAEFLVLRIELNAAKTITELLDATGRPSERLRLGRRPVCAEGVFLQVLERDRWITWAPVGRIDERGPEDRVYVLDRKAGELIFGDGRHGALPPAGAGVVQATYRYGSAQP